MSGILYLGLILGSLIIVTSILSVRSPPVVRIVSIGLYLAFGIGALGIIDSLVDRFAPTASFATISAVLYAVSIRVMILVFFGIFLWVLINSIRAFVSKDEVKPLEGSV